MNERIAERAASPKSASARADISDGSIRSRLAGEDVDAHDLVLARQAFLAGAAKGVELLALLDFVEADGGQDLEELSQRESAGDSTGPEVDVPANGLRQLVRHNDVAI